MDIAIECISCREGYKGTFLGDHAGPWGQTGRNENGGCFSKVMRIEEKWAIKIPEGVPPTVACPLLCGGGTVFESVCDYVKPGTHVAVASIGGLGTAAIKFAHSYGGHVTALSHSEAKREKCLAIGAKKYYSCLGNADKMKELAGKFDVIIDTSPANEDVAPFMEMLAFNGTYCRVGIPPVTDMEFKFSYIPLIFTQKKIAGSIVTGTRRMKQMLQLTLDDIEHYGNDPEEWKAEVVPFEMVNKIIDDLKEGRNKNNYRYVLEW